MRLKHLELQGYKTFAHRTEFFFDGGITAIVGPNGSGKSNVADAIRWVLGEQSYRALRGKRTEDMIFSGSAQRARLGMASASLILDNADGWLPIDFVEVTITRRAFRSGENEYRLNGKRVRLRDISELLAKSGLARRTYTVVSQGLVDSVLSLRAEDRRALFEEAAGISLYQSKRAEALSRLDETRANLLRVNDIINEISPRLHRLERQAEKAERYGMLAQQLDGLLRTWYGFRWRDEGRRLVRAGDSLKRREDRVGRRRLALEELGRQMAALRVRQHELRDQLGVWHRESSGLHRKMEEVQRDLAVWQERSSQLARQYDERQTELAEVETQLQITVERIEAAEKEVAQSQLALEDIESQASLAQAALDAHEGQRATISQQMADTQAQAFELTTRAADRRNRLAQLEEQREALVQERQDHGKTLTGHQARAKDLRLQLGAIQADQARLQSEAEALESELAKVNAALDASQTRQAGLRRTLTDSQGEAANLQSRYEMLSRVRDEGEGLHPGVRSVLRAARTGGQSSTLSDIVGTVTQLVRVPAEYEIAVEVALGPHLQDVVVESWPAAEKAISFLREKDRGRATFLPLDTVRPVKRLELPDDGGIIGVAADLVRHEKRLKPAIEMLLGRAIVVRDLKAARRVFEGLRGGFQIVTLSGEVLRSSGSVTGGRGRGQAQGQVLAREREWRELPSQLEAAEKRGRALDVELAEAAQQESRLRDERGALAAQQAEVQSALAKVLAGIRDLERDVEKLTQQIAWRQGLLAQLETQAADLSASESTLESELTELTAAAQSAEGQVSEFQAQLDQLRGEDLYRSLSEARTTEAVARGTWTHRNATLRTHNETLTNLQAQIESRRKRLVGSKQERAALLERIEAQSSQEVVVQGWLTGLTAKIEPAEAEVAGLDAERDTLEEQVATLRARLRQAETSHSQAVLARSRQEDRLERVRRQIMDDFGLVDMETTEGLNEQPPLPLGELVSSLPVVEVLPDGLEDEVHQIKAQLRRMGSVNPTAPEEYGEMMDRYTFLSTQAADLDEAATTLREVIAELDEIMQQEFDATFERVADRFKVNFVDLFGGGNADLILTEPENVSHTGVEIVARPPGKRAQTLALLSGGERSLAAVALIFSLLEVSPPPFCIMDEVDAMLDEANVARFRSSLARLSEETQFIVITHNRGTIQAADTIYGISMGEDSISQAISLRLEGERLSQDDGTLVDVRAK